MSVNRHQWDKLKNCNKLINMKLTKFHSYFSLSIRNGIRHIESGEFEEQNGQTVFIVRGFFEQITKEVRLQVFFFC